MKLTITIGMDNAAFQDNPTPEAARILRDLAKRIDGNPQFAVGYGQLLRDVNGNDVGWADVKAT